jgi:hypothetical protein
MAVDDINWDESTFIIIRTIRSWLSPERNCMGCASEEAVDPDEPVVFHRFTLELYVSSTGFVISLSLWQLQIRRTADSNHG